MMRPVHPIVAELLLIRRDQGLTQATAAEKTGVTRRTIGNWETGYVWPALRELSAYADGLGYDITLTPKEATP